MVTDPGNPASVPYVFVLLELVVVVVAEVVVVVVGGGTVAVVVDGGAVVVEVDVSTTSRVVLVVVSGWVIVVEVGSSPDSGACVVVLDAIAGAPRAVGVSVTSLRTLLTAAAAITIATRVVATHAAAKPIVLLISHILG